MNVYNIPNSSQINRVGYDPASQSLDIQFHGKPTVYRYKNVSDEKVVGLLFSPSAGKYFGANIKNQHADFEKFESDIAAGWQGALEL